MKANRIEPVVPKCEFPNCPIWPSFQLHLPSKDQSLIICTTHLAHAIQVNCERSIEITRLGSQPEPSFIPVTLTLETQKEVDAIFGVLNHVTIRDALGLSLADWNQLQPYYKVSNFDQLNALLKP